MEDLAHLLPASALTGDSSMAGGNMVSDQSGAMSAPGSESEQMQGIPVHTPVVDTPPRAPRTVMEDGGSYRPSPVAWSMLPQNGYSEENP